MNKKNGFKLGLILFGIVLMSFFALGVGYSNGSLSFNPNWLGLLLNGTQDGTAREILISLRLPRLLCALLVGAALALAGTVLQSVSKNPLADPFLLGISGGAALLVVIIHGVAALSDTFGWWIVPITAFVGAQAATVIVLSLARGPAGKITVLGIILGGVVINAFCAAVTMFLMIRFDPHRLKITTLWLAGSLSSESWPRLAIAATIGICAFIYLRMRAYRLNTFALGEEGATGVGIDTDKELKRATVAASLLAGIGVSLSGLLGYVGLVVPHIARMLVGTDLRSSLTFSAAIGALLLLVADTVARLVVAPQELPVGVLAALAGCPVLLILLKRELQK